ncbi:MAG: DNA translocase FtsK 4TM domain-containing protein [Bacteroidetes bacterium]|nr:DNA translocase FtsK 4TM domain-containing protein [Bacteroidota bacterium]
MSQDQASTGSFARPKKPSLSNPESGENSEEAVVKPKRRFSFSLSKRLQRLLALVAFTMSAYALISACAYIFYWRQDQSLLFKGINAQNLPENPMGYVGNWLGHQILYNGFGFASFFLFPFAFNFAIRGLFGRFLPWVNRNAHRFLFFTFWTAILLGHLNIPFMDGLPAGILGFKMAQGIGLYIGTWGTTLALFFSLPLFVLVFEPLLWDLWLTKFKKASTSNQLNGSTTETEDEVEGPETDFYTHKDEMPGLDIDEDPAFVDEFMEVELESSSSNQEGLPQTLDLELDQNPIYEEKSLSEKEEGANSSLELELSDLDQDEPGSVPLTENPEESSLAERLVAQYGEYDPHLDLADFKMPPLELLVDHGNTDFKVDAQELEQNKDRILETLKNYGVEIQKIKATIGPTVTLYEIVPAPGVRISKIKNLEDDIALSLAAQGIRIIAPIPGKGTIGIEVPNQNRAVVGMRKVMQNEKFAQTRFDLPIALGRTISNDVFVADLAKMPHLLVAGATGQGKSVGINAILVSLLYKKHPSELKFVMVDPKKVELTLYNIIEKHYLAKLPNEEEPIITDVMKVVDTLNSLCIEMDNRYELLKAAQVRNLKEYNVKFKGRRLNPNEGHRFLPYIVLVIDEFADLIMTAGKEVELPIARIAQLARAVGIHVIIATQRPSVNIITGTIKANFPARLAFRVSSKIDSRTILDTGGAEQLIGQGDMLLSLGSDLVRLQCPFVDTPEVEDIVHFIGEQRSYPEAFMLPEYVSEHEEGGKGLDPSEKDDLFNEAARIIVQHQQGSASLLQRRLNIGYNRAGRLIDQMEAAGIVGPNKGSKAREVLIQDERQLSVYLDNG